MNPDYLAQAVVVAGYYAGDVRRVEELGNGRINATFLVHTDHNPFIVQRLNPAVFPDPLAVVRNFRRVTEHLNEKRSAAAGAPRFAALLPTRAGEPWCRDHTGAVWRAQSFLAGRPLQGIHRPAQAVQIGRLLGQFHRLLGDLPGDSLEIPLPGFHVLPGYLAEYDRLADRLAGESSPYLQRCSAKIEQIRPQASILQQASEQGILPVRTVHGDPKVENFLFDQDGQRAIHLIDLDTVGPGLLHHDLGDGLRSCCNRGGEGGDARTVRFDLEICRAFLMGYETEMAGHFDRIQREYVFAAVLLITFELGLRFFTDHLRGDTYFRVNRAGENLERALVQFALVDRILEQEKQIRTLLIPGG
jgi:Ser/Thr protein kinase RdoA (MazF antagonist)